MIVRAGNFLLFFIMALQVQSQVIPLPEARLNYTEVMFEYPRIHGASLYLVQVAEDTNATSFERPFIEQTDSATATLITGLQFGKKYHWRYAAVFPNQKPIWKGPYRFETISDTLLYKNLVNLQITKNDTIANAGGLILNDCTHSITDRNGNMVWFLQNVDWHVYFEKKSLVAKPQIYDLRLTPSGTITYLADSVAVESDLAGKILWKGPNNGKISGWETESYNHDFKLLPNGHYMVLGNELWRKLPSYKDTATIKNKYPYRHVIARQEYAKVEFGTLIEYDKSGKVVWNWNSSSYLDPDPLRPWREDLKPDWDELAHINAFSIDKKSEYVYVGFRNISRIVKIEKKSGKVVDSWGQQWSNGGAQNAVPIHRQHDANILDDSTLAVFNSNDYPGKDSFSRALIISTRPEDDGKVTWAFDCNFDSLDRHAERNGGNIDLLKNGNFLVCMGNMNRIFEVTRNKKIVWAETIKTTGKVGDIYFHRLYRAHYISSLYPCYFVAQAIEDTVSEKSLQFAVKIFNKGSESDSYWVNITTASGTYSKQVTTEILTPGASKAIQISPDKHLAKDDKIMVTVISKTNPDFKKIVAW